MEAHYKKSTEQSLRSKMVGEYEYKLCPTTDKMRSGTSEKQWSRKAIFSSAANLYRDVFREEMLRPFLKCLSLFAIVAFSGLPCLTTYMKKMFQDLDLSINSNQSIVSIRPFCKIITRRLRSILAQSEKEQGCCLYKVQKCGQSFFGKWRGEQEKRRAMREKMLCVV